MALRFRYLFFIRVTQLVRLWWLGHDELAIEVVMLRHEVSVLRRQVTAPGVCCVDLSRAAASSLRLAPDLITGAARSRRTRREVDHGWSVRW
jgi:hypothetical protein